MRAAERKIADLDVAEEATLFASGEALDDLFDDIVQALGVAFAAQRSLTRTQRSLRLRTRSMRLWSPERRSSPLPI